MLSKPLRNSVVQTRFILPPAYLLPCRAKYLNTASHFPHPEVIPEAFIRSGSHICTSTRPSTAAQNSKNSPSPLHFVLSTPPAPTAFESASNLSDSTKQLLPLLKAQTPHYITILIYGKPYLVTQGDIVRLPFHMHGVNPGDILRLNRASTIGSRDYTMKAGAALPTPETANGEGHARARAHLDERLFECRAVVMGTESEPMRIKEKTKQRQRRVKTVKSKHRFSILRIKEVSIKGLDQIQA